MMRILLLSVNSAVNPSFTSQIHSFAPAIPTQRRFQYATFFHVLPTPRPYARFPFYNMMNNEDFYLNVSSTPVSRSELHTLRLAGAQDLWYGGGGAFRPKTFGYTGRASGGNRSLANVWDVSLDVPRRYGFSDTTYYVIKRMPGGRAS
jgi:hypothetical protein